MRTVRLVLLSLLGVAAGLAQGDRGSITGTVVDPAGAVVAGVGVEAKNTASGSLHPTVTTSTGNYTISELPPGSYQLTITAPGFKTLVRGPIEVGARQILRIDGTLEVGATTESVTVTDAAPLLITESAEVSYNVSTNRLNDLPVGNMGSVRNIARTAARLMPGVSFTEGFFGGVRINGSPTDGYNLRIDGMDNTYTLGNLLVTQVQPSVEAIEQYSIQTSNFAAELGQSGGAIFNVTMKSGTNKLHGSAFDYWATDDLYAAHPYLKTKSAVSTYDWGFTLGGPIAIPKVYNGRDKSFFFVSYESRPQSGTALNTLNTVPTDAYRSGDFSAATAAVGNRVLGTDPMGRPIIQNAIYDPASNFTLNGQVLRNPFPNNQIPVARFDPVAVKVLALVPKANLPGLIQNFSVPYETGSNNYLPSFKIDHNINAAHKLNFFYSWTGQRSPITTSEGFPSLISAGTISTWTNKNYRLNYDWTVKPTILVHLGAGYQDAVIEQASFVIPYDVTASLGLKGPFTSGKGSAFPNFGGASNAQGGLQSIGQASFNGLQDTMNQRPTGIATLTWVKNNHTYKFGGELRVDGFPNYNFQDLNGFYQFSANQTALPYLNTANVGGNTIGFPFASFLLGQVNTGNVRMPAAAKLGQHALGFYAQDSWKVTRKITLDYGLRYDYSTYQKEQYGRQPTLDAKAPNRAAGGQPGATTYEATCNCRYAPNYPYAWGPRLGAAYQINSKTVIRGGIGLMYNTSARIGIATRAIGSSNPFEAPAFSQPAMVLETGVPLTLAQIAWPNFDPSYYPIFGRSPGAGPPNVFDQNAARPARQVQWSIGLQRQILRDLVVEAAYVGNRGVWWPAGTAVNYNTNQPQILRSRGIDINNPADVTLLNSPISSPAVVARGFRPPFTGFPASATLAQALRPYPQFSSGLTPAFAPLGSTWYDSLQVKVTKRMSHGLDFGYAFTFQKSLSSGLAGVNDVWNRPANKTLAPEDQKFQSVISFTYTVPKMNGINKVLAYGLSDWQLGGILSYSSGFPIPVPAAQNNLGTALFQNTRANRVPGVPLFLKDLNSHFDPNAEFVLNPAAWADPAVGQWGTSAPYYSDFRYQRRPNEAMNFGRNFRVGERFNFQARLEFTNIFNRIQPANPVAANARATPTRTAAGVPNGGFGWVNAAGVPGQNPRQGQLVLRLTF
jgi:hypothetical protein